MLGRGAQASRLLLGVLPGALGAPYRRRFCKERQASGRCRSNLGARSGAGLFGPAAALAGCLAIGCANETAPQEGTCGGETPGTSGEIVETGQKLEVACVSFGGYGAPGDSTFRHGIDVRFADSAVVLAVWFHTSITAPVTLDLATPPPASGEAQFGANLFDYRGFEGGPRRLCSAPPGFPVRAAVSGAVKLDKLTVGQDGFLDAADGEITAQFEGCTIELLSIQEQDISVHTLF